MRPFFMMYLVKYHLVKIQLFPSDDLDILFDASKGNVKRNGK